MTDYFADNRSDDNLSRRSLHSGAILMVARLFNVVLQIGSTFVLARLISPHDYGLVAMVASIVGFAPMLIELGTTDAAVQKQRITPAEVSSLFWFNVSLGLALAILVAACSPLIVWFYREPELQKIAIASSISFVVSALCCQHYALLRRAMKFKRIATIDLSANLLSTLAAIGMALGGLGYWALVCKPILGSVFTACGVWGSCRWVPGPPTFNKGVKEMLGFGAHVTGFTMTDYASRSVDRVALGYFYGASPLGYFQNAMYVYDSLLGLVTQPLHSVAVSSLTKLRDNLAELRRAWAAALSSLSFFAMGGFAVLAVTSSDVVAIFLGPKWAPAGPLLGIFALRGIAHVAERTLGWLHVAAGRSDRWMRWGVVSVAIQLVALFCGLPWGLTGVAAAYALATYVLCVPALVYAGRPVQVGAAAVLKAIGPSMVAALCSVAVAFWIREAFLTDLPRLGRLILVSMLSAGVYAAIVIGIFRVTAPLRIAISLVRGSIPKFVLRLSPAAPKADNAVS